MQLINQQFFDRTGFWLLLGLLALSSPSMALESDRQEPLEVSANSTDGTLGDGATTLRGNVDIRQGTLHIKADEAQVNKADGRVTSVIFRGAPASLEQEIEEQGRVKATANTIDYQVASGLVTLTSSADVQHPQYQISGELLTYDLNTQHFQGSSDENGNGRIQILFDPEVINGESKTLNPESETVSEPVDPDSNPVDPDKSVKEIN